MSTYKSGLIEAVESGSCLDEEQLFEWEVRMDREIQRYLALHPDAGVVPINTSPKDSIDPESP